MFVGGRRRGRRHGNFLPRCCAPCFASRRRWCMPWLGVRCSGEPGGPQQGQARGTLPTPPPGSFALVSWRCLAMLQEAAAAAASVGPSSAEAAAAAHACQQPYHLKLAAGPDCRPRTVFGPEPQAAPDLAAEAAPLYFLAGAPWGGARVGRAGPGGCQLSKAAACGAGLVLCRCGRASWGGAESSTTFHKMQWTWGGEQPLKPGQATMPAQVALAACKLI